MSQQLLPRDRDLDKDNFKYFFTCDGTLLETFQQFRDFVLKRTVPRENPKIRIESQKSEDRGSTEKQSGEV